MAKEIAKGRKAVNISFIEANVKGNYNGLRKISYTLEYWNFTEFLFE